MLVQGWMYAMCDYLFSTITQACVDKATHLGRRTCTDPVKPSRQSARDDVGWLIVN